MFKAHLLSFVTLQISWTKAIFLIAYTLAETRANSVMWQTNKCAYKLDSQKGKKKLFF